MNIPLCKPFINDLEIEAVSKVLKSGWLAHGPKTEEFEKNFANYIGTKHAISVNSCTSALELAIKILDLKGEIILPSFTFVASANSIVNSGCTPVFVDIDDKTFNIDPKEIESKITDKTVAIMPVHFAGQACDMDSILKIANKHNLIIIEDSAETIGGTYKGKKTGTFGIGCFSFYPTKNMTTGEGGMITINDDESANKISALRAHGILSSTYEREKKEKPWLRAASFAGHNYRLGDIQSTLGIVQLKKLDEMNKSRRKNAEYLNKALSKIPEIETPFESENCKHVYQMYIIKLDKSIDRTKFILNLREQGIGANVHFDPPVHLQPFYKEKFGYKEGDLPITERVTSRIVTLPMYPDLTNEEMNYMIKKIGELIKNAKR